MTGSVSLYLVKSQNTASLVIRGHVCNLGRVVRKPVNAIPGPVPELSFLPAPYRGSTPGFSPYMGQEERRVSGTGLRYPRIKSYVNRSIYFSSIKMLFTSNVLSSSNLVELKTEGQTNRKLPRIFTKLKSKFSLILG